jgi:GNAT superfamily N-acetyltransferase
MALRIERVTASSMRRADAFFSADPEANGCWCMWFIIPVKAYHAAGSEGNCESFHALAASSDTPIGLLAYDDIEPVGWCAVGPRARYARAILTPTYKGRDPNEDQDVWLVPCFNVRADRRKSGVTKALLEAAINLAREHGATAIEGFPLTGTKRHSKDTQVGFDSVFMSLGFRVIRTPSESRAVVRLDLAA